MTYFSPFLSELADKIDDANTDWTDHQKDVFRAIRQCILDQKPIDKELQDQYVKAIASQQAVNKYGL